MTKKSRAMCLTDGQIEQFRKDPNVKSVKRNRISFTFEFRTRMYECWVKNPSTATIRSFLSDAGYDYQMLGSIFIWSIHSSLKKHGKPTNGRFGTSISGYSHKNSKEEIDRLLSTGKFVKHGKGIAFSNAFVNELFEAYPEQSIEDGLRKAGIDPAIVGYQRIYLLKREFDGNPVRASHPAYERTYYSDNRLPNIIRIRILKVSHINSFGFQTISTLRLYR